MRGLVANNTTRCITIEVWEWISQTVDPRTHVAYDIMLITLQSFMLQASVGDCYDSSDEEFGGFTREDIGIADY